MKKGALFQFVLTIILFSIFLLSFVGLTRLVPMKGKPVAELAKVSYGEDEKPSADIFHITDTDGRDDGVARLISLMEANGTPFYMIESNSGLFAADDVILIKVNCQWNRRGGTNSDLLHSLVAALLAHPGGFNGEVVIADNGQAQFGSASRGGSMDWEEANSHDRQLSFEDVANRFAAGGARVSTSLWDRITRKKVQEYDQGDDREGFVLAGEEDAESGITVSYPKFRSDYGTLISFKKGIWQPESKTYQTEKLKVINLPVLKTHFIYGVTGAVKNYMGTPSDKLTRNAHNTIGLGSMGTQMAKTRVPTLNILDAVYVNPYTRSGKMGPSTNYDEALYCGMVAASTDPVALDYWGSLNILFPMTRAAGDQVPPKSDPTNLQPGNFGYWLRLSLEELRQEGYAFTMEPGEMTVFTDNQG